MITVYFMDKINLHETFRYSYHFVSILYLFQRHQKDCFDIRDYKLDYVCLRLIFTSVRFSNESAMY